MAIINQVEHFTIESAYDGFDFSEGMRSIRIRFCLKNDPSFKVYLLKFPDSWFTTTALHSTLWWYIIYFFKNHLATL